MSRRLNPPRRRSTQDTATSRNGSKRRLQPPSPKPAASPAPIARGAVAAAAAAAAVLRSLEEELGAMDEQHGALLRERGRRRKLARRSTGECTDDEAERRCALY